MGRNEQRVKHRGGFGKFILGWLTGILTTILLIAGLGYWAYKNVNIKKVEKWTKTEITNNEGIESKTIKQWIAIVNGVMKEDANAYTIAQFEEDFGVKLLQDSLYGIDLTPVKNSAIKNIKDGLNEAIDNATFSNILSFMELKEEQLGLLDTVLDSETTYYINNNKLYTDNTYATEVDFNYEINDTEVRLGNTPHTIKTEGGYSVVTPMLRHIPLQSAISNMDSSIQSLTLGEALSLEESEAKGVVKTFYNTSIKDLASKIEDIKIYEALGYTREGTEGNYTYKDENNNTVTGLMATLAPYSVNDLSNSDTFNDLYIYEVKGYYYNSTDGKYYQNYDGTTYSNEVTGIMAMMADAQIKNIETKVNNIINNTTLNELFNTGVIDGSQLSANTKAIIGVMTIPELMTYVDNMLTTIN